MANIDIWCLRDDTTKELIAYSYDQFVTQAGQEQVEENIDEDDFSIFGRKYRFDAIGDLEINGKSYYILELLTDAVSFSPDGVPQLDVGGLDSFNLTVNKKDIQGNSHTLGSDDDTLNVFTEGGKADAVTVDLVNGQTVIEVKSGVVRGKTKIRFEIDEIASIDFEFLTV